MHKFSGYSPVLQAARGYTGRRTAKQKPHPAPGRASRASVLWTADASSTGVSGDFLEQRGRRYGEMPTYLASPTVFVHNNPFSQRQPSIVRTLLARVPLLVADHPSSSRKPVHSTDAACPRPIHIKARMLEFFCTSHDEICTQAEAPPHPRTRARGVRTMDG